MLSSKLIMTIIVAILYIAASTALPTRTSTTDTSTRDSSSDVSGSGSSSGDDCDAELSRRQVDNLVSKIETSIDDLYEILEDVHVWTHERASVGVYTSLFPNSGSATLILSDYAHAIALSVSYFQMFLRPVGDVLTNETVYEVIDRETGFADEFSTIRSNLTVIINRLYKLVKGSRNIHECILPNIPLNTTYTTLNPLPPFNVTDASFRDMIVDGVAYELQSLTADLRVAFSSYYRN